MMGESGVDRRDVPARGHSEPPMSARTVVALVALLAAAALVYGLAVFGPPFYTKGEPREGLVVLRILADGEIILPRRTATELPTKPPLFHWMGAAISATLGEVTEGTVRSPSLLASLATIALTVACAARLLGPAAGLISGVVLATSQQWIVSSVTARVDMVLAAAITAAMFATLWARARGDAVPAAFWAACALAVLAKGPVGLLLPLLCVAVFALLRGDASFLARSRPLLAVGFLSIPLLWYALAWHRGGDEFAAQVVTENLQRMLDADAGEVGHRHSAFFYAPALAGGMAPWSLLLLPACVELWSRRADLASETRGFLLVWAGVTIAFYSLADSKRPVYLLSCYPALAVLIGDWLARRFAAERSAGASLDSIVLTRATQAFAAIAGVACGLVALQGLGVACFDLFTPLLSASDAANLIPIARAIESRPAATALWVVGTLGLLLLLERSARSASWRMAFAAVALMVCATTALAAGVFYRDLARTQSVKPFITAAVARLPDGHPLYYYAGRQRNAELYFFRSFEYSAAFYAGRPLTVIDDLNTVALEGRSVWFITTESVLNELRQDADGVLRGSRHGYSLKEIGRYTYGDNSRRTPVVFVEARRG